MSRDLSLLCYLTHNLVRNGGRRDGYNMLRVLGWKRTQQNRLEFELNPPLLLSTSISVTTASHSLNPHHHHLQKLIIIIIILTRFRRYSSNSVEYKVT